jgi:hypothetical protein
MVNRLLVAERKGRVTDAQGSEFLEDLPVNAGGPFTRRLQNSQKFYDF